jgi:hypothetical protein
MYTKQKKTLEVYRSSRVVQFGLQLEWFGDNYLEVRKQDVHRKSGQENDTVFLCIEGK